MSYYNIDFFVTDTSPMANPIAGVVLRVYSVDGKTFYTEVITDEEGHGGFLLDDSVEYTLRLYKFQVSFVNPQRFAVTPEENTFDVQGVIVTPPVAVDPRLCRASGFFRRGTGAVAKNVDIHFIPKFKPLLLDGAAVLTERDITRTDANGYAQIDLIRLGQYDVTIQGMEDMTRTISVPDAPSVNLPDLLFPVVSQIVLSPVGPYIVTIGTDLTITPTITTSDGAVLTGTGAGAVVWGTGDPTVAAVLDNGATLALRALGLGSTSLTAERFDKSVIRYPDIQITGVPVAITVPE